MTDKCSVEGCQLEINGHCSEHKIEVERRKNMQKVANKLNIMFYVNAGSLGLLLAGLSLTLYLIGYVNDSSKQRFSEGMSVASELRQEAAEINQQSINRDHLVIEMIEGDRAARIQEREMQTELLKATERITIQLQEVTKDLDKLQEGKG